MCHKEEKATYYFDASSEDDDDLVHLIQKLNNANLPEYVISTVQRDLNRLRKLPASSSDSGILRTYIEYIGDLPWSNNVRQEINISFAKNQLDHDHFGYIIKLPLCRCLGSVINPLSFLSYRIEHVKKRIVEYLSVLKVKSDAKPPILCLVGPVSIIYIFQTTYSLFYIAWRR